MRTRWILAGLLATVFSPAAFAAKGQVDLDGDGIPDVYEEVLGADPASPDAFRLVLDDGLQQASERQRPDFDATKDFTAVESCHVGDDRYLWRVTFAVPPRLEDTVLHLYIDADANPATGRQGSPGAIYQGTEYMLSVVGARPSSTFFRPEGSTAPGPVVTCVVDDKTVLISADVNLKREASGARYDLYVLCHTISQNGSRPRMSDSSRRQAIAGLLVSDRKKRMRPRDYTENHRVAATYGHDLLQATLAAPDTVAVEYDKLESDGFSVDSETTRRWGHLKLDRPDGKAWTTAPKAGRYRVGFMMYDDSNDERVLLRINGELCGVAVARQDNNRTWLYFLQEPYEFRGGERVELQAAGAGGKHGITSILFLGHSPEVRSIPYEVRNFTATTPIDKPGSVILSWITTWPSPTHLEYGTDAKYGKTVEAAGPCLVHRAVLGGLDPAVQHHARAVGTRQDGSTFCSDDFLFRTGPPAVLQTQAQTESVPLTVRNPHRFAVQRWPVTTGVPFPRGRLGSSEHVRLVGSEEEVPAQIQTTARWPDGSVKWLLVTFQASAPTEGEGQYRLEFGRGISRSARVFDPATHPAPAGPGLAVNQDPSGVLVDTGAMRLRIDAQGNLAELARAGRRLIAPGATCQTGAIDSAGKVYRTASKAEITVEEVGPLRAVIKTTSHLIDAQGARLLAIQQRIEAFRDMAVLRVHHTLLIDRPELFTTLKRLWYRVPVAVEDRSWRVPLAGREVLDLGGSVKAVRQRFDDEFVGVGGAREVPVTDRIIGAISCSGEDGCAVALRDFWQNYPKGFSLAPEGLDIDLCPALSAGLYDRYPFEREGHQLYYYLLGGQYRLKRGVSKTHELLLCFEREGQREQLAKIFQEPLLAAAPPEWYCASKAFYDLSPRDPRHFAAYEQAIDKNLAAYAAQRERQRDYGMLNYGDWYGERGSNWGNIEYDTQHAFFLEYIRSGRREPFFLGESTELHNRDIDTVQWAEKPDDLGAVYVHQMCHVGDYYDKGVPGTLGYPRGGFTVSHAWVEGHFDHYFLTGDRRSYETGCQVADYFIRKELGRPYDFSTTRTPGWHLIMLAAAHAATRDPYYLNASRVIAEHVLELQDKRPVPLPEHQREGRQPYQIGGWSRMLGSGHCDCPVKHRGNPGFMIAVLLSGLKYYHDVTGDPRVKESIIRGSHYLLEETYSDEVKGFRYTSCPKTGYRPGASPLMVEGVARAYLWTKDERFRRVLVESLPLAAGGSPYGKSFSMYYRMAPRVLADLVEAQATGSEPLQ